MIKLMSRFVMIACASVLLNSTAIAESILDKVKREGTLKVCVNQLLPDLYKDPKTNEWTGVMADLMKLMADWMKVKIQPVEIVGFDVSVLSLKQGNCDLIGSSLTYTALRAMEVDFIRPFGAKGLNAIIAKNNPKGLRHPSDLNDSNITLVVDLGSREHDMAMRLFPKAKLLAVRTSNRNQIVEHVQRGDADAAILSTTSARWWLQVPENAAWGALGFPGEDFGNTPNGWAIRYGDSDWKNFLDNFSNYVAANNISVNLYEEYMTRPGPLLSEK